MIEKELSRDKTERLFIDNAIMIGDRDVLPMDIAEALLGLEAVEYAGDGGTDCNEYWLGCKAKSLAYLTKRGFYKAVTYRNVMLHIGGVEG